MADAFEIARGQALALAALGRRAHSEAELRGKLLRKGFAEAVVEAVLARLKELGYLDDAALARDRAAGLLNGGRLGPGGVRARLLAQGVSEALSDEAVRAALGDDDEATRAEAFLRRHLAGIDGKAPLDERRRAGRRLLARGFSEEVARRLLDLNDDGAEST